MIEQKHFEQNTGAGLWCVLRTSGARTLALARSLKAQGIEAWAPEEVQARRLPRSSKLHDRSSAMLPTFVFAEAQHLPNLVALAVSPLSRHPAFTVFRFNDRYPLIASDALAPLRRQEDSLRRRRAMRYRRASIERGTLVRLTEGAFAGLDGVVDGTNGKFTAVRIPGFSDPVKIATWLLLPDVPAVSA